MGKNVAKGKIPYKEFSFVHPPIQIYILAFLFKLFGTSLLVAKILPLISSSLVVLLIYLISKELYNQRIAILSSLFFLITPTFLAFSDQGYGMWESLLFFLLSIYLLIKNKIQVSALSYIIGVFVRYLTIIYFPFILILIFLKNRKNLKKFSLYFVLIFSIFFFSFYVIFGYNFINQTILFQIVSKTMTTHLQKLTSQYLSIGFFTIFLATISTFVAFEKKHNLTFLFSIYPILADLVILFTFKTIAYHYFLFSVPLVIIATSKVFMFSKDAIVKIFLLIVIVLSIVCNFQTIEFYWNPTYSKNIHYISKYVMNAISKGDNIFGESSIVDYISFTTGIPITSNYLDSYIAYLEYIDEKKVIQNLEKEKPKFIIDMENYYISNLYFRSYLQEKYTLKLRVEGIPNYFIYERKV
ncbi:MAG: glycosyltransferase family 39 protein [Candidatus Omnitrophica bacterium]|nr:glycosyltransferase family 39 protein [Candidatus Omnitrophota bacterium]